MGEHQGNRKLVLGGWGALHARSKTVPPAASRSRFGVCRWGSPYAPSSDLKSSTMMWTMFRCTAIAESTATATATATIIAANTAMLTSLAAGDARWCPRCALRESMSIPNMSVAAPS